MREAEVTIIGAGPAGMTAALFLAKNNIPVTLIDKESFPRDKVCGDCLGGYALSVLRQIDVQLFDRFFHYDKKLIGGGVHFFGPDQQKISTEAMNEIDHKMKEVALCRRINFDNFLMEEIRKYNQINVIEGVAVSNLKKDSGGISLYNQLNELLLNTRLVILATGSSQNLVYKLTKVRTPKKHTAAGIRAYFEGITLIEPPGYIELHFLKELIPGYLWIFPLPGNLANVGIGLRSDVIARKNININTLFFECIQNNEYLNERFLNANQISDLQGFPLALSISKKSISGDHFLLSGDAANLIEPLFGEGIGHAMYSGKFAAEQAIKCIEANNFSNTFNNQYDKAVYQKLGSTLRFSKLMHRIAFYPKIINFLFNRISKNAELKLMLTHVINGKIAKSPWNGFIILRKLLIGY
jgi:geranylgeranyl reductase family protein